MQNSSEATLQTEERYPIVANRHYKQSFYFVTTSEESPSYLKFICNVENSLIGQNRCTNAPSTEAFLHNAAPDLKI